MPQNSNNRARGHYGKILMSALDANVDVPMTAEGDFASTIQTGEFLVNLDTRVVSVDGKRVHLTGKEYGILELLSLRKGSTVTKEMFLNHLYAGMDEPEIKIIDVFVCKLRKKLAQATGGKHYIETVWGRGHVLGDPTAISSETNVVGQKILVRGRRKSRREGRLAGQIPCSVSSRND